MKMYAFWWYDIFPNALGAEVTSFNDDNTFEVQGFTGYTFRRHPGVRFLPADQGELLKEHLKQLEAQYSRELSKLQETYVDKRNALFVRYGISAPERE